MIFRTARSRSFFKWGKGEKNSFINGVSFYNIFYERSDLTLNQMNRISVTLRHGNVIRNSPNCSFPRGSGTPLTPPVTSSQKLTSNFTNFQLLKSRFALVSAPKLNFNPMMHLADPTKCEGNLGKRLVTSKRFFQCKRLKINI